MSHRSDSSDRNHSFFTRNVLGLGASAAMIFGAANARAQEQDDIPDPGVTIVSQEVRDQPGGMGWAAGLGIAGAAAGVGAIGLRALHLKNQPYEDMLKDWNLEVTEVKKEDAQGRQEAYRLRLKGMPNYNLDPAHGDNECLQMKIVKSGENAGVSDELDDNPRTRVYLVKKDGKAIATFRLTRGDDSERSMLIDRIFTPAQTGAVDKEDSVEISFTSAKPVASAPLRTIIQMPEVLALVISRQIVEFAHETGAHQLLASTTETGKKPFAKIHDGRAMPDVFHRPKVMGRDDLTLVSGDLQQFFRFSPPETLAIIDPNNYFSGPGQSRAGV